LGSVVEWKAGKPVLVSHTGKPLSRFLYHQDNISTVVRVLTQRQSPSRSSVGSPVPEARWASLPLGPCASWDRSWAELGSSYRELFRPNVKINVSRQTVLSTDSLV
jgi:hypothetical protein